MIPKYDTKDEDGNNYLHHLVNNGKKDLVESFLNICDNKESVINGLNNNNESPLYLAVKNNDQDLAQLLYDNGANINNISKDGLMVKFSNNQKGGNIKKNIIYGTRKI